MIKFLKQLFCSHKDYDIKVEYKPNTKVWIYFEKICKKCDKSLYSHRRIGF